MRIIAGRYKGRKLPGNIPQGIRPTSDAVRESIFNVLSNWVDFEETDLIADFFSGTGALGFEALSRGAASCIFVDKSGKALAYLKKAAAEAGIENNKFLTVKSDAVKSVSKIIEYTNAIKPKLIFADPPYDLRITNQFLEELAGHSLLHENGIVVAEHGISESAKAPAGWDLLKSSNYGDTCIDYFRARCY